MRQHSIVSKNIWRLIQCIRFGIVISVQTLGIHSCENISTDMYEMSEVIVDMCCCCCWQTVLFHEVINAKAKALFLGSNSHHEICLHALLLFLRCILWLWDGHPNMHTPSTTMHVTSWFGMFRLRHIPLDTNLHIKIIWASWSVTETCGDGGVHQIVVFLSSPVSNAKRRPTCFSLPCRPPRHSLLLCHR